MSGFIEGEDRTQATLFPERIDDYVADDSPVRVVNVFIDDLEISGLGFRTEPNATGRPSYQPKMMLKLYVYGYLNRVQSSRRLERAAIRLVCREFVMLCRKLGLLNNTLVAIDGSKFKAVNNRDKNFTRAKMKRRLAEKELYKSLTWDGGKEMADHTRFTLDTKVKVYFCDPQSPWQRGSNENTNGLLRQYFPKGMDLSNVHQNGLNAVARRLNERPRETLNYRTPAECFRQCVASTN